MRAGLDWLKVSVDLADHKKSLHLAALLNEPLAFAYLIRLWSWCGKGNAMDGIIRGMSAECPRNVRGMSADVPWNVLVESAVAWRGDSGQLADALVTAGWLDPIEGGVKVHDWDEHAGAFIQKAEKERARKRAKRNGNPPRNVRGMSAECPRTRLQERERERERERKEDLSAVADATAPVADLCHAVDSSPGPTPADLQRLWNETAGSALPRCRELSESRRRAAKARLAERNLDEWREVIQRINASAFCRGEKPGATWRATFDWLLRPGTAAKVLEGQYDDRNGTAARGGYARITEDARRAFREEVGVQYDF
jgi:hypothetical protein